jgi:putative glycosyltransferase (TIGR04372 family)
VTPSFLKSNEVKRVVKSIKRTVVRFLVSPVVLLIFLLRPLVVIRLGQIDIGRIGGVIPLDWYLAEKRGKGMAETGDFLDLFLLVKSTRHVNSQWEKMWRRTGLVFVSGNPLFDAIFLLLNDSTRGTNHVIPDLCALPTKPDVQRFINEGGELQTSAVADLIRKILDYTDLPIWFTENETKRGQELVSQIGIERQQFICFHNRDSKFLDKYAPQIDWSYHDYRDSDIDNYVPAMEYLAVKGYFALRMGLDVSAPIRSESPNVVDYSMSKYRSDFNDIYLGANCRFFVCSDTGISTIPERFRRPIVLVNWLTSWSLSTWIHTGLVIFKKLYDRKKGRFLTFSELLSIDLSRESTMELKEDSEMMLIENTPDEIVEVTAEMEERLNGTWQTTALNEELQAKFWELLGGTNFIRSENLRIGSEFLKNNEELLR